MVKIVSIYILLFIFSLPIFGLTKMPGTYIKPEKELDLIADIGLRIEPKNGAFEHYFLENEKVGAVNLIFSIFDSKKDKTKKWLEMGVKSQLAGNYTIKFLNEKGLLKGKLLRFMLKMEHYLPFEIPVVDNPKNRQFSQNMLPKVPENQKLKPKKIKEDTYKFNNKIYKIDVYKGSYNGSKNGDIETVEYALFKDKDTTIFGIAYIKAKHIKMFLKGMGTNGVSSFPKKVGKLDILQNMQKMSKDFYKREDERKKALEEEKKIEKIDDKRKDEDPIDQLNNMIDDEKE